MGLLDGNNLPAVRNDNGEIDDDGDDDGGVYDDGEDYADKGDDDDDDDDDDYGFIDCWLAGIQVTSEPATKIPSCYW